MYDNLREKPRSLIGAAQTRLELLAEDLEVQSARVARIAALGVAAAVCLSLAAALGSFLLVVVYWDSHRLEILALLTGVFAAIGTGAVSAIRWMLRAPRT